MGDLATNVHKLKTPINRLKTLRDQFGIELDSIKQIASGGFAVVYEALGPKEVYIGKVIPRSQKIKIAIKEIDLIKNEQWASEQFHYEMNIPNKFKHYLIMR